MTAQVSSPPFADLAARLRRDGLVIASHNPGKVREIAELLDPFGIAVRSAGELGLPEPDETGASFAENARIKAESAARAAGLPALADDSGLAVAALGGAPGIHSARWGGPERDFALAMRRVWEALEELGRRGEDGGVPRDAAFICALALALPEGPTHVFEGRVDGEIVWPPRGGRGFGYDPIFVPRGHALTFGEMEPAAKHAISHRADAFRKLVAALFGARG
ncbi:MAG: non-canonical purine NTP pyrophosphatase [Rhodothalassiaceae bacterium]|nr:MAG: non-canonical purine NTP pyrophosphatase [Rhodothalassiaceae bacterium]